jgi:MFS superfamily sulfate permease-like transporter
MASQTRWERLAAWLPGLRLLFAYNRTWWRHDLPAARVVTLVLIPMANAYATETTKSA